MQWPHLSPLHDHGLPAEVDWPVVAAQVARIAQQMSYPPVQLAIIAPNGEVRAWYLGSEQAVGLPHVRDLGLLYQATVVLEYPTGTSPSFSTVVTPLRAASPLIVLLSGDKAHLVSVWHRTAPGLVAELVLQAPTLESGLARVRGFRRVVPRSALRQALCGLIPDWHAFAGPPDAGQLSCPCQAEPLPLQIEPVDRAQAVRQAEAQQPSGWSHMLVRYLGRLQSEGRFSFRPAPDGTTLISLDGHVRAFASEDEARRWLSRAHQIGFGRLFQDPDDPDARHSGEG